MKKTHHIQRLIHMWHDCSNVSCLSTTWYNWFMCLTTHSYMTWLIHMWHDSFICDMTHSYVTWLIHMWHDYPYVPCPITTWYNLFMCVMTYFYMAWLIHMRRDSFDFLDITDSYVSWLISAWSAPLIHSAGIIHKQRVCSSCHMLTCQQVNSEVTDASCHVWMSHVTYEWVMNESCRIWMRHVTYECAGTIHKQRACSSCRMLTCQQVNSEVTAVISRFFAVSSAGIAPTLGESRFFMFDMTHSYAAWLIHMWHHSFMYDMIYSYATWRIHMRHGPFICDMTSSASKSYMWHHFLRLSFICDMTSSAPADEAAKKWCHIWISHICDITDVFIWISHVCDITSGDMTHSYAYESVMSCKSCDLTSSALVYNMTHSYMTWLIHMRHDSFVCDMTHSYATWLIHMWHDFFGLSSAGIAPTLKVGAIEVWGGYD